MPKAQKMVTGSKVTALSVGSNRSRMNAPKHALSGGRYEYERGGYRTSADDDDEQKDDERSFGAG